MWSQIKSLYDPRIVGLRIFSYLLTFLENPQEKTLVYINLIIIKFVSNHCVFFCFSIGGNVKILIDRPDGAYCFRERKDRVYYLSEKIAALASNVGPDYLLSAGTCFGKFTKSGKFLLHITSLNYLAPYAQVSNFMESVNDWSFSLNKIKNSFH